MRAEAVECALALAALGVDTRSVLVNQTRRRASIIDRLLRGDNGYAALFKVNPFADITPARKKGTCG